MGGVGAPRCKTCGKVEWRHVCSGAPVTISGVKITRDGEYVDDAVREVFGPIAVAEVEERRKRGRPAKGEVVETDRKEYQREKAREYRARKKVGK